MGVENPWPPDDFEGKRSWCDRVIDPNQQAHPCPIPRCSATLHRNCVRPHVTGAHPNKPVPPQYLDWRPTVVPTSYPVPGSAPSSSTTPHPKPKGKAKAKKPDSRRCKNGCGRFSALGWDQCCTSCGKSDGKRHGPSCQLHSHEPDWVPSGQSHEPSDDPGDSSGQGGGSQWKADPDETWIHKDGTWKKVPKGKTTWKEKKKQVDSSQPEDSDRCPLQCSNANFGCQWGKC